MECTNYSPYQLPTIDFVGGETQEIEFHIYFYRDKKPFSLSGCTCNFSIVSFMNPVGKPVLTKPMSVSYDDGHTVDNVLYLKLESKDTVGMSGKYVYQISIQDVSGDVEIPKQGILYVANNIDKSFLTR